ncbi:hypothetical protein CKA32_007137 [Geitlerinema sp. FC II]|nr:hypothetical protein CKA32_007137 [Geitlerinema sp. FC II]
MPESGRSRGIIETAEMYVQQTLSFPMKTPNLAFHAKRVLL